MRKLFCLVVLILLSLPATAQTYEITEAELAELEQIIQTQAETLIAYELTLKGVKSDLNEALTLCESLEANLTEQRKFYQKLEKENQALKNLTTIETVALAGVVVGVVIYSLLK